MKKNTDSITQLILEEIINHGQATRAALLRAHPLRPASLQAAVNRLKAAGLLFEADRGGRPAGRRSPPLTLRPDAAFFLGLELTDQQLRAVWLDAAGEVRQRWQESTPALAEAEGFWRLLPRLQRQFSDPLAGVALADPGLVDPHRQISLRAVMIGGWENLPTGERLRACFGCRDSLLVSECGARTFLESWRSPDRAAGVFVVHLDRGVGGGFCKGGELFVGDNFRAMEIGHLVLNPDGPLCRCGGRGCLEASVGEANVIRRIGELLHSHVRTELAGGELSLDTFLDAVARRDRAAERLARELCQEIAPLFPLIAALLNPAEIVISGRLARLGDLLLDSARQLLRERCLRGTWENMRLRLSAGDDFDAASGAALLLRNTWLRDQAQAIG